MSVKDGERIDFVNENITLTQKTLGLTFGTDAYLLYAYLRKNPKGLAADLGAGTGIISLLAAAKGKFSKIYVFCGKRTCQSLGICIKASELCFCTNSASERSNGFFYGYGNDP